MEITGEYIGPTPILGQIFGLGETVIYGTKSLGLIVQTAFLWTKGIVYVSPKMPSHYFLHQFQMLSTIKSLKSRLHSLAMGILVLLIPIFGGLMRNYLKERASRKASINAKAPFASFKKGKCYLKGDGVALDRMKAYEWFLKAAIQNEPNSQLELGRLSVSEQNDKAAIFWFREAEKSVDKDIRALAKYELASHYYLNKKNPLYSTKIGDPLMNASKDLGCLLADQWYKGGRISRSPTPQPEPKRKS